MADNTENIYVAFDYNNIIIVDPNKIIDSEGRAKERVVKQENLVIYANLECSVTPRTKLAIGTPQNLDAIQTISIAEINFLNPGKKRFLDNEYTNEITGNDSLKGGGQNQSKLNKITETNDKGKQTSYIRQTKLNQTDNGLLGITQISIRQGLDFTPQITISLEDIKGRALFESGENSPYGAFFHLPYPPFYLTIKGYYGKALRLTLMLSKFNARYDTMSGNFKIQLDFYTYKYSVLVEIPMGHALAVPYMYPTQYTTSSTQGTSSTRAVTFSSEIGKQKLEEVYREYISKKLLPENFQFLTIKDLYEILSRFIKDTLNGFVDTNLQPLTNISEYLSDLDRYLGEVYSFGISDKTKLGTWFELYIDKKNPYVTTDGEIIYYIKKGYKPIQTENLLKSIVDTYNTKLNNNETCGQNKGKYERAKTSPNGISVPINTRVPNKITINTFKISKKIEDFDIDAKATLKLRKGIDNPTIEQENFIYEQFKFDQIDKGYKKTNPITQEVETEKTIDWYIFDGEGRFLNLISKMKQNVENIKNKIQDDITESLSEFLQNQKPLGFTPNIRNVLGVIFANAEAFLRLMDRVHDKAWALNKNEDRIRAILPNDSVSADRQPNQEKIIYPWPQLIVKKETNGKTTYEPTYPGDVTINDTIGADNYSTWPEVEFVEEYVSALVNKVSRDTRKNIASNEFNNINRISINAAEFPVTNEVYFNQETIKFIYEIFERINFTVYYSRINRNNPKTLYKIIADIEKTNVYQSLKDSTPELLKVLKNSNVTGNNYVSVLKDISNKGLGVSWNTWISGFYNTIYISNKSDNSFIIRPKFFMDEIRTKSDIGLSVEDENDLQKILTGDTKTNKIEFTDIYPFTNNQWINSLLSNGKNVNYLNSFNTTNTLIYQNYYKTITNFIDINNYNINRPITHFMYKNLSQYGNPSYGQFKDYYSNKLNNYNNQLVTEGNTYYGSTYKGLVSPNQTTSILNTPYFVNAIQKGVTLQKQNSKYPYVAAAYLFLNGLPLITGYEKLKNYNSTKETDYLYATLKKYGAIHKLPYAWILKIGSIWYRYSKYITENVDILDDVWKDFDYVSNYDPIDNSPTKKYVFTGKTITDTYNIVLEEDIVNGTEITTSINSGFYPKLINDFSYFYSDQEIIKTTYNSIDIENAIKSGKLTILNTSDANIKFNKGFDDSNLNRQLSITSYSTYLSGNTNEIYLLPSVGFINQTKDECFKDPQLSSVKKVVEVKGNKAMYNGSVRNFWGGSNFGYFDNSALVKPKHNHYMKNVYINVTEQQNFTLSINDSQYTLIEELFSLFDYKILESFKEEFLNFSKSSKDFNSNLTKNSPQYYNFQLLMRNMMKINKPNLVSTIPLLELLSEIQKTQINSFLSGFLEEDIYFVYGNPSNYNKKLFYTFSDLPLDGKYSWETYTEKTPNSLPNPIGTINLSTSKTTYPNAWKALELYVGFSSINYLNYDDNGSFITDFFIENNIAFTELNIKNFAPIIKLYATQKLNSFQENKINTNKPSNEPILVYSAELSDGSVLSITEFNNTKDVSNIKSGILVIGYTSTDSVEQIVDDFLKRPQFSNLVVSKVTTPPSSEYEFFSTSSVNSKNSQKFKINMTNYLTSNENDIEEIVDLFWPSMTKDIDTITTKRNRPKLSELNGDPQTKLELWEMFKSLNDKWIAGNDYESKTLFEDVMLLDRASRNIGDKALVDIFSLKEMLDPTKINLTTDVLTFVEGILVQNNFVVMTLPAYINFYGVQNVSANPRPSSEGVLNFANTLFGTFLNVDYRDSSSKLVCMFDDIKSEYVDMSNNPDYRFSDDSFDITRASDHPLSESLENKTDFDKSNKVVGFNVDIGVQNQQIIKSFSVGQTAGLATSEALEILNQMANQGGHRSVATQNLSLYTLYKNRSYNCNLTMMGNALIQPTMYFNLRYVPMFSGPYMITEVNHSISQGEFSTDIVGVRQPIASLPILTNFLQGLRTNLIKKFDERVQIFTQSNLASKATNIITQQQTAGLIDNNLTRVAPNPNCKVIVPQYNTLTQIEFSGTTSIVSFKEMKTSIYNSMSSANVGNDDTLAKVIFSYYYYNNLKNNRLEADYNNFGGVDLLQFWGPKSGYFELTPQYFCKTKLINVSTQVVTTQTRPPLYGTQTRPPLYGQSPQPIGQETPYAVFGSLALNTRFFVDWWNGRTQVVDTSNTNPNVNAENISKFIILNRDPSNVKPNSFFDTYKKNNKSEYDAMVLKIVQALTIFQTS